MLSHNLTRRHLTEAQRAMVAAKVATLKHGVRSDRVDASIDASTQDEAAKLLNVGRASVQRARVVHALGSVSAARCERLGIDSEAQRKRLQRQPWACATVMVVHDASGRSQEMTCLHLDCVPMWLATIHASRVNSEHRPTLALYQRECARVLRLDGHDNGEAHSGAPRVPGPVRGPPGP